MGFFTQRTVSGSFNNLTRGVGLMGHILAMLSFISVAAWGNNNKRISAKYLRTVLEWVTFSNRPVAVAVADPHWLNYH